jgi:hypothetical protein
MVVAPVVTVVAVVVPVITVVAVVAYIVTQVFDKDKTKTTNHSTAEIDTGDKNNLDPIPGCSLEGGVDAWEHLKLKKHKDMFKMTALDATVYILIALDTIVQSSNGPVNDINYRDAALFLRVMSDETMAAKILLRIATYSNDLMDELATKKYTGINKKDTEILAVAIMHILDYKNIATIMNKTTDYTSVARTLDLALNFDNSTELVLNVATSIAETKNTHYPVSCTMNVNKAANILLELSGSRQSSVLNAMSKDNSIKVM